MLDQVFPRHGLAGRRHHVRLDGLAGLRVVLTHHRGLGHAREPGQDQLDLVRVDVKTIDDDQLAQTVDQEQVAVLVGVGDITGKSSIEFWTRLKKSTVKWNSEAGVNWMS